MLRQDPDVILIGELRDAETAETALQAAESGHLVLSTMHTVDAAETVGRLVEFFPAIKQPQVRSILAGVLKGVVSQRLLPRAGGGRVAAVEVMVTNSRIAELIRENKPEYIPEAIADGGSSQMQTLTDALIALVLSRDVDRETAANSAPNRHDFSIALEHAMKEQAVESVESNDDAPELEPIPARALGGAGFRLRRWSRLTENRMSVWPVRARLGDERAVTLTEVLVVMAILVVILGGMTTLFVAAGHSQGDQTNRARAQQEIRLALDSLRREIHCAANIDGTVPGSSIEITLGDYCPTYSAAQPSVLWCTKTLIAGERYVLLRYAFSGALPSPFVCGDTIIGGSQVPRADSLIFANVFETYTPPDTPPGSRNLGKLKVVLSGDLTPTDTNQRYTLEDEIALRNTSRVTPSP